MPHLIKKEDCSIIRPPHSSDWGISKENKTLLIDSEGDIVFVFHGEWRDDQIWHALLFVNAKFHHGVGLGIDKARDEMKKAIGID